MPNDLLATWKATLRKGLQELEAQHQRRALTVIGGVNLCSNDYLGLAAHPALRKAVVRAVENTERVGGTGSRLLSGQTEEWRELEREFANFVGMEAALFFGSGYAANMGLLTALVGRDDVVYSDMLNHASLIDGIRLSGARKVIYPHLDLKALEESLQQDAGAPWRRIIVTESVFSMNGDVAPMKELASLASRYGAAVIVDEAHATGVHGAGGRGLAADAEVQPQVLAAIHTCGKALGSAGAFVCGPAVLKEHLINHARTFIFSTALPPYFAEQIRAALKLAAGMDAERQTLLKRARGLLRDLRHAGFDTEGSASQIVPVVVGKNEDAVAAAEHLRAEGFGVRAIRPPTVPAGRARLRLSLTIQVAEEELKRLVKSLVAWRENRLTPVTARRA
ncbi:MAG TPA: 8-amino-7-oxononanoate synthase [Candidatus Limnocylindrales bacterium]|nr:8-amino-7-oxononanoate synthase [Candidatus Limnocylindrales bacterium]